MISKAPVILRGSLIVGMKNYATQKDLENMKDLDTSHKDVTKIKKYLMDELNWPDPAILTDNCS